METKKSKSAELESKRSSFLIIGLVCATSLTLMSFEYATFNLVSNDIASEKKEIALKDEIIDFQPIEVEKPAPPKVQEEVNNEIIDATDKIEPEIKTPDLINPNPVEPSEPVEPTLTPPPPPTTLVSPPVTPPTFDPEFTVVEEMPEFPGGQVELYKYLGKNINYPEISKSKGAQGKVYVSFVIEKNGSITGVEIMKGVEKNLDKEAKKVIEKMPNWKPGKQRGQLVRVRFIIPVNFELK
jgi:periplasmic protein TonB